MSIARGALQLPGRVRAFLLSANLLAKAPAGSKAGKQKMSYKPTNQKTKLKKTGMTHLKFQRAVSSLNFESMATDFSKVSVPTFSHQNMSASQVMRYLELTESFFNLLGYFKPYQHHELFAKPISLVSENTLAIYDQFVSKIDQVSTAENRICLEGERGCGKSTLLAQATALARSRLDDNLIVMHFGTPEKLSDGSSSYFLNAQSGLYHQPMFTKRWIFNFKKANAAVLKKLPLLRDIVVSTARRDVKLRAQQNSLLDFLEASYDFGKMASTTAWDFFIEELRLHSDKVPVLVTIDDFNTMVDQPITQYRHPDFTPIHISEFEVGSFLLKIAGGSFKFQNGGVLCATTSTISLDHKTLNVCLKHEEYDPYLKTLDRKIATMLLENGGIKPMLLKNFSKTEARLLLQFYRNAGVLQLKDYPVKKVTPATAASELVALQPAEPDSEYLFDHIAENKFVTSGGNPGYLLRASVMSF